MRENNIRTKLLFFFFHNFNNIKQRNTIKRDYPEKSYAETL
jgi:hypothetical protein